MNRALPVVFTLGQEYQIILPVQEEVMMWIQIGTEIFYDSDNGIFRSDKGVRRVSVPKDLLEREKGYTIFLLKVKERKAYFTETKEQVSEYIPFYPVKENARAFHIGDVHNHDAAAIQAAKAFGKIDFLILNGDIPNHCDDLDNIFSIYRIAAELTRGNVPVVFSRGNHDMRGKYAEHFSRYTPHSNGKFYYTFRLGNIWGMVLDCGEDKLDEHQEYGNTICCDDFRRKETEYIKSVIENRDVEYLAPGITHRMVISHIPFTKRFEGEFDIAEDIYSEWTRLLREDIKPQLMVCAHEHQFNIYNPGEPEDAYGQPCPVVIGAEVSSASKKLPESYFAGTGLIFEKNSIKVIFIDSEGVSKNETFIKF